METLANSKAQEERRQAQIRRQIVLLQAQLNDAHTESLGTSTSRTEIVPGLASPKRKQHDTHLLAPATPSPSASIVTTSFYPETRQRLSTLRTEKRRINRDVEHDDKRSLKTFSVTSSASGAGHRTSSVHNAKKQSPAAPPKPNRSNLLDKLSKLHSGPEKSVEAEQVERSSSFGAKARYPVFDHTLRCGAEELCHTYFQRDPQRL